MPTEFLDRIHLGDCVAGMNSLPAECVDLAFADPPFNIGYKYDVYDDRREREHYLDWSREWIGAVHRVLKPDGTFWLAIGDEYAAELKIASQEIGFTCRSWVVWYYTFGVNCKNKFTRSHAHLFYFVKDPERFTFLADDPANRIPSARQLVYNDARANPRGRLPDDTWILRPQDLDDCFTASEDTWYFPRVAGTFKERAGFHGCQMPEQLLGRIIRCCSNAGAVVLDPFSGSATTLVTAKKLGRHFIGFELSPDYAERGSARVEAAEVGAPLVGAADPTRSAPSTAAGRKLEDRGKPRLPRAPAAEPTEAVASVSGDGSDDASDDFSDRAGDSVEAAQNGEAWPMATRESSPVEGNLAEVEAAAQSPAEEFESTKEDSVAAAEAFAVTAEEVAAAEQAVVDEANVENVVDAVAAGTDGPQADEAPVAELEPLAAAEPLAAESLNADSIDAEPTTAEPIGVAAPLSAAEPLWEAIPVAEAAGAPPAKVVESSPLVEAFRRACGGYSLDRVVADPKLQAALAGACRDLDVPGTLADWNVGLFRLRKTGKLSSVPTTVRTERTWDEIEPYVFAAEIAAAEVLRRHGLEGFDDVLCDPALAAEFDKLAAKYDGAKRTFEHRWAALKLRKEGKQLRTRADELRRVELKFTVPVVVGRGRWSASLPRTAGIYLVLNGEGDRIYVGAAADLRSRIERQLAANRLRLYDRDRDVRVAVAPLEGPMTELLAHQIRLVAKSAARLNWHLPVETTAGEGRGHVRPAAESAAAADRGESKRRPGPLKAGRRRTASVG